MRVIVALILAVAVYSAAMANDIPETRQTLKGVRQLGVVIDLDPIAKDYGITEDLIRTDVELKLRLAGIKVESVEQMASSLNPYLALSVNMIKSSCGSAYMINIDFHQATTLARNPLMVSIASTWSYNHFGTLGKEVQQQLREFYKIVLDKFLNAYLEANPKQ